VTRIAFTSALARFVAAPPAEVPAATVAEALDAVFLVRPGLRGYVLDDQGSLRRHVAVYVNGEPLADRVRLSDAVGPQDEIYVIQALTGG
jgi:sulfur-carrier protein